jgi:hypothetical protein
LRRPRCLAEALYVRLVAGGVDAVDRPQAVEQVGVVGGHEKCEEGDSGGTQSKQIGR